MPFIKFGFSLYMHTFFSGYYLIIVIIKVNIWGWILSVFRVLCCAFHVHHLHWYPYCYPPFTDGGTWAQGVDNCPRAGQLTPDGTCHLRPSPGIRSEPFYLSLTTTAFGIVYFLSVLVIFFLPCCRMKCGLNTSIKQDDQDALREKHEEGSF